MGSTSRKAFNLPVIALTQAEIDAGAATSLHNVHVINTGNNTVLWSGPAGTAAEKVQTSSDISSAIASGAVIKDWSASTAYEQNAVVRATASIGTIDVGDIIRSNSARTSGATFDATEAANWTNLGAELVRSVAGKTGTVALAKADVGLGNVDNTSDASKPISTAQQTALNAKEATANKNALNGYAGLDASGKLAASQMPMSVITGISRAMPDNIITAANLGIYLLADDLAAGAVSAWDNKAETTDFTQATAANQPVAEAVSALGNRLAAKFDGSASYMETASNINLGTRYGLMAVIVPGATLNGEHPILAEAFGGGTVEYVYGISANQFKVGHYNGAWRSYATGTPVNGTAYILVTGYDGSNLHIKVDGGADSASAQTSDPTFTEASAIRLGRRWDFTVTSGNLFHGHIACVVAKKSAYFTATEIEQLEGWAAWYYNLASKLPAGHKYKNTLPIYSV